MDDATLLLGVIAAATAVMALVQLGLIVVAAWLARRLHRLVVQIETEIAPTMDRVNDISGDVTRATSLAVAQAERADELFATVAGRVDRVTLLMQDALIEPVRYGTAVWQGVRASVDAVTNSWAGRRDPAHGSRRHGSVGSTEDEEALFIG